jgi:hypothetical protein
MRNEGRLRIAKVLVTAAFAFLSLAVLSPAGAQYAEGQCGGVMRGYDGRGYPCEPSRKPVCEQSTGRCVCLLKRECGAKRDEGWYSQ